jgi:hypothetical protein
VLFFGVRAWASVLPHLGRQVAPHVVNCSSNLQCVVHRTDLERSMLAIRASGQHMSPNQVVALGPELLPWAREYTNDLNEAHFLVHQVVTRLARDSGVESEPIDVDEARALMTRFAQRNGAAGLAVT